MLCAAAVYMRHGVGDDLADKLRLKLGELVPALDAGYAQKIFDQGYEPFGVVPDRLLGRRSLVGDYEDIDIGRKLVEPVDKRLFSENRGVGRAFADSDLCRAAHPCVLGYLRCGILAV